MGLLQTELEESKQFDFETIEDAKDTCLVKLNRKNVALAEAMIRKQLVLFCFHHEDTPSDSSASLSKKLSSLLNTSQPKDYATYHAAYKEQ